MTAPIPIARGAAWTAAGTAVVHALSVLTALLTARALGPEPFGTVGMAWVGVALASAVLEIGLGPAIASRRIADGPAISAAHGLSCALGIVLAAVTAGAAPAIAWFFRTPAAAPSLFWLAPTLVLGATCVVPVALLQRDGRFATLALLRITQQLAVSSVTLLLLLVRRDALVLLVPALVGSALMGVGGWLVMRERLVPSLRWAALRPHRRAFGHFAGYNLCNFLARNGDNAIVGRIGGERTLGLYAFAYGLLMRPLEVFSHSLVPVLITSFGQLRADRSGTSAVAERAVLGGLRLGAPVFVGGALTAHLFVPLLFGARWADAIPLVRVLMFVGALQIPGPVFGALLMAQGSSRLLLRWGVWTGMVSMAAFVLGAWGGGALGVAIAYLLYNLLLLTIMYLTARRYFGLPLRGLGAILATTGRDLGVLAAAVAAAEASLTRLGAAPLVRLPALVGIGGLSYLLATRALAPDHTTAIVSTLPPRLRGWAWRVLRLGGVPWPGPPS